MRKDAGLDDVTLHLSKISEELSISLGHLPWISSIGNKVIISQVALDLLDDREVVAVLGHELGHLKHNAKQIASRLVPEEISLGVAAAAGTGVIVAAKKCLSKQDGAKLTKEENSKTFSRRNLLTATAAALAAGGTTEYGVARTDTRGRMQRRNEYEADMEGVNLSGDKHALISAFLKMWKRDLDLGFIYDGLGSHPTFSQRIDRLNGR